MSLSELNQKIKKLEEEVRQLKKQKEKIKSQADYSLQLKEIEFEYCYVELNMETNYCSIEDDLEIIENNFIFKNTLDAEKHAKWQKAFVTLVKAIAVVNNGWIPDRISNEKIQNYFFSVNREYVTITKSYKFREVPSLLIINTEQNALLILEQCYKEILIVFNGYDPSEN